jgi:glycosyltransferase involved in cell wall biosynthesis
VNVKNIFSTKFFSNILNRLERFIIRHSDATIVLSDKALDLLKKDEGIKKSQSVLVNIPCCVDLSKFSNKDGFKAIFPKELERKFVLAYLGSLGTCYLLKEMAGFFKVLKERKPNSIFLIISHTEAGYIEGVLKGSGLAAETDFIILKAKPEEVPALISKSDCSIMMYKPSESKIGCSPTKLGESLAAGVPVIVNEGIGDTEKIISDRRVGVVLRGFNDPSYVRSANELLTLLKDEGLKRRCIDAARDNFSLELGVKKYFEVYEAVGHNL